jgi:WD40 repeat protein
MRRVLLVVLATIVLGAAGVGAQRPGKPAVSINGGNSLLYVGTYAGNVQIFDETSEKQIGEIKLQTGIPRSLVLSFNKQRFYVLDSTLEKIETVDIASRTSLGQFTLSSGPTRTRIRSMQVDPLERFMILLTRSATKRVDRWEISDVALQLYDLKEKKITKNIPWPGGEARENVNIRFSPDGKLLYFFGDDILILETDNFTEVDSWAYSRPLEQGLGRMNFGPVDDVNDEPGFFTGLFTVQDPVHNRRIMGIARVNLAGKTVDFSPIGPAEFVGFAMTPDRKRGYGLLQTIEEYEMWTFDLESYRVISRTPFRGRPRMGMRVSSNGSVIYIHTAGNTIDLYDSASFKLLRTITLDGDMTGFTLVPPSRPTADGR